MISSQAGDYLVINEHDSRLVLSIHRLDILSFIVC